MIAEAEEAGAISEQQVRSLRESLEQQHQKNLTDIVESGYTERQKFAAQSATQQTSQVLGELTSLTAGVAQRNKTLFKINKAAAIANATINTFQGVTKTLSAYPMPIAAILAAAHLAAGLAQVQAISSASFGGGGAAPSVVGGSAGGAGPPQDVVQQQPVAAAAPQGPVVNVTVNGSVFATEVREIVADSVREVIQNDEVLIPANSRQAEEILSGTDQDL